MKIKKSLLDKYIIKKEKLKNKKIKIQDNASQINKELEIQIKFLINKQKQNKADEINKLKKINRKLDKLTGLISVEKDYARNIENI